MVAVLALAAVAACGSGTTTPRAGLIGGSASPTPSASGGWTGYSPIPGSSGIKPITPQPTTRQTTGPSGPPTASRVNLGRSCVHRGSASEQQSLAVRAGPGETVTYSTYYSDYSTELNRPDYTTGHGYGVAASDGFYRASWTVPAGATPGKATVRVTATDMAEDAQEATFAVVKEGERCP